jgi:hypothetical protein
MPQPRLQRLQDRARLFNLRATKMDSIAAVRTQRVRPVHGSTVACRTRPARGDAHLALVADEQRSRQRKLQ